MQRRHYVLIGIILLLLVVNLFRNRKHAAPEKAVNVTLGPAGDNSDTAALWPAYDHAAGLRDAEAASFQPALASLKSALAAVPNPNLVNNARIISDVNACTTWLLFYRQAGWKERATTHVDSCVHDHRDEAK